MRQPTREKTWNIFIIFYKGKKKEAAAEDAAEQIGTIENHLWLSRIYAIREFEGGSHAQCWDLSILMFMAALLLLSP